MVVIGNWFDKFRSEKKRSSIAAGCLLGLLLFLIAKGCVSNHLTEKTYSIGQDTSWKNLNLMGREKNLTAFNQQLMTAIAKQEKMKFVMVITSTADLIDDLENGNLQGILTDMQPDYLNEEKFLFSDTYFLTGPVLIIPSAAAVEGWNEKRKKIVGLPDNSSMLGNLEQDPTIQIRMYHDILSALTDLSKRNIDGVIFPVIPAYTYVNTFYKNELKITTHPLTHEGVRLVVRKNEEGKELLNRFNQGIESLKKNGEFDKLLNQWGFVNVESF